MSAETRSASSATSTRRAQLWHKAADVEQHRRAALGQPWRTRCGQNVKPAGASRKSWDLTPMERCVVCMSIPHPDTDPSP